MRSTASAAFDWTGCLISAGHPRRGRTSLEIPDRSVLSDLAPDAVDISCRNLVDNALRHGNASSPVEVTLRADGELVVANEGALAPPESLARLTERIKRAADSADGSGLGLALGAAVADRIGSRLVLRASRPGLVSGIEASVRIESSGFELVSQAIAASSRWRASGAATPAILIFVKLPGRSSCYDFCRRRQIPGRNP